MTLNRATSIDEYEQILELIESLHPNHFSKNNIKGVYLKKLNDADLISQNKSHGIKGKTSHIAVTTDSMNFFKEILGHASLYSTDDEKYFDLYVDSKHSEEPTVDRFVLSNCAIWVNPKVDSPQIGLSRIDGDGTAFMRLRKSLYKDDFILFFKYLVDNKIEYYVLGIQKDNELLNIFTFDITTKTVIKYYENFSNDFFIDSNSNLIGFNRVYYGAPGSGKSHLVRKKYDGKFSQRILFHNDFQYADFVGHIKPKLIKEGESTRLLYEFENGPFVDILIKALNDKDNMYTLIIEELNRANAPSVFGDLFQLLDRNSEGVSEYTIYNMDIFNQIKKVLGEKYSFKDGTVFIPSNLSIVATMNNSDQNTVVLDTAFKRRWEYHYVPVDFTDHYFKDVLIDKFNVSWYDFVTAINNFMFTESNRDLMLTEDKQIGQYFSREKDILDYSLFSYKVLLYLWDDVFKYNRDRIFRDDIYTFDHLLKAGREEGVAIFTPLLASILLEKTK